MREPIHVVGKCIFEVDVDDPAQAEAVFDRVSELGQEKLPTLIEEILRECNLATGEALWKVDRLEIDLNELDEDDLEESLLRLFREKFPLVLQAAVEQEQLAPRSAEKGLYELLEHFLRHGRYPWWADGAGHYPTPEEALLELIYAGELIENQTFINLLQQPEAAKRISKQFSARALQLLLGVLFPAGKEARERFVVEMAADARQAFEEKLREDFFWQQAAVLLLGNRQLQSDLPSLREELFQAVAAQISKDVAWVKAELEAISESKTNGTAAATQAVENETGAETQAGLSAENPVIRSHAQHLQFFLQTGRLPQNSNLQLADLESTLLQWIEQEPENLRQFLVENERAAERLVQQFSVQALQVLMRSVFPAGNVEREVVILQMTTAARQAFPDRLNWVFFWQQAVGILLKNKGLQGNLPLFREELFQATAVRLGEDVQWVKAELEAVIQSKINGAAAGQTLSTNIPKSETTDETVGKSFWENVKEAKPETEFSADAPAENARNFTPTEHLQFFLQHGRLPQNSNLQLADLESLLLQWIEQEPENLRQFLVENERAAERLVQQFSAQALQVLLRSIFPVESTERERVILQMIEAAGRAFPDRSSLAFFWQQGVVILLKNKGLQTDAQLLREELYQATAVQLGEEVHLVQAELGPIIQSKINGAAAGQTPSTNIPENKTTDETVGKSFSENVKETKPETEFSADAPAENARTFTSTQHLQFFLQTGRLPQNSNLQLADLENLLLQWIEQEPENLRQFLFKDENAAKRLVQQFSVQALQVLMRSVFPAGNVEREVVILQMTTAARQAFPDRLNWAFFWQQAVGILLKNKGLQGNLPLFREELFQATAVRLGEDVQWVKAELEAVIQSKINGAAAGEAPFTNIPESETTDETVGKSFWENVKEAKPETELSADAPAENARNFTPTEHLQFFLQHGRLPQNSNLQLADLESILLQWIEQEPENLRQFLVEDQNAAKRLVQQFSVQALQVLLRSIFSVGNEQREIEILQMTEAANQAFPDRLNLAFFWQQAVGILLKNKELQVDTQLFREELFQATAAQIGEDVQLIKAELEAVIQSKINGAAAGQTLSTNIPENKTTDETVGKSFSENVKETKPETELSADAPAENARNFTPTEHLQFFLQHGRLPQNSNLQLADLESLLLQWIEQEPENLQQFLVENENAAQRLVQQFSVRALQVLMHSIFPMESVERESVILQMTTAARQAFPDRLNLAFFWQQAVSILLKNKGLQTDAQSFKEKIVQATAIQLGEDVQWVKAELEASKAFLENVHQPKPETEFSAGLPAENAPTFTPNQHLQFFLQTGRLPQSSNLQLADLQNLLLQWIEQEPKNLRQFLVENEHAAERLVQQFSVQALRVLMHSIFPVGNVERESVILQMTTAAKQAFPDRMNLAFFWQRAVGILLENKALQADTQLFREELFHATAAQLGEDVQLIKAELEAVIQSKINGAAAGQTLSTNIPENKTTDETVGKSFSENVKETKPETEFSAGLPAENARTFTSTQYLQFFLQHGRLPQNSNLQLADLESILLQWIEQEPENLRQFLVEDQNAAKRLVQQFSVQALQVLLHSIFSVGNEEREVIMLQMTEAAGQTFPDRLNLAFFWQQAVVILLKNKELQVDTQLFREELFQATAIQLGEDLQLVRVELEAVIQSKINGAAAGETPSTSIPESETTDETVGKAPSENVKEAKPETEFSADAPAENARNFTPTEHLQFFLQHGRLRQNSNLQLADLQNLLLQWIEQEPENLRQFLVENEHAAERLVQQFSVQALQVLLRSIFPVENEQRENVILQMTEAAWQAFPDRLNLAFFWQQAVGILLKNDESQTDVQLFREELFQATAIKLGEDVQLIKAELEAVIQSKINGAAAGQTLSTNIPENKTADETVSKTPSEKVLEAKPEPEFSAGLPAENARAFTLTEHLQFFLQTGRLPQNSNLQLADLEKILLQWIEQEPENLRQFLVEDQNAAKRLVQQFSVQALQVLLRSIFSVGNEQREIEILQMTEAANQAFPDRLNLAFFWQQAVGILLKNKELQANTQLFREELFQATAVQLGEEVHLVQTELEPIIQRKINGTAASEAYSTNIPESETTDDTVGKSFSENVKEAKPETEFPAGLPAENARTFTSTQYLQFFLQHGRLPQNSNLQLADLEKLLLQWIEHEPENLRQFLVENEDAAGRLVQQFSVHALQVLMHSVFPVESEERERVILQMTTAARQAFPDRLNWTFFWQRAVGILLKNKELQTDVQLFRESLFQATAIQLGEDVQWVKAELEAVIQSKINGAAASEAYFTNIPESETTDETVGKSFWENVKEAKPETEFSADLPAENAPTFTPNQHLQFFLQTGRLPQNSNLQLTDLESILLQWIEQEPENLRQFLVENERAAKRLVQQFSVQALQALLHSIFPVENEEREVVILQMTEAAGHAFPDRLNPAFFWQQTIGTLLKNKELQKDAQLFREELFQATAVQLGEDFQWVKAELEAVIQHKINGTAAGEAPFTNIPESETTDETVGKSFSENVKEAKPETEFSADAPAENTSNFTPTQSLQFFLQTGRLPQNSNLQLADLENLLLQWIEQEPENLRQFLIENERAAERLVQQFSVQALQVLMRSIFSVESVERENVILKMTTAARQVFPDRLNWTFFWQQAVGILLKNKGLQADTQLFQEELFQATAVHLGENVHWVKATLEVKFQDEANDALIGEAVPRNIPKPEANGQPAGDNFPENLLETPTNAEPFPKPIKTHPETTGMPDSAALQSSLAFYLRAGRLPAESPLKLADLDPALRQLLATDALNVRKIFLDLHRQVNLTARLSRHFSMPTLKLLLENLLNDQWQIVQRIHHDFTQTAQQASLHGVLTHDFFWKSTLQLVFQALSGPLNLFHFVQSLIAKSEEVTGKSDVKFSPPIPAFRSAFHSANLHPETRKLVQWALNDLSDTDHKQLEQTLEQWRESDAAQSAPQKQAEGAAQRILSRLQNTASAWWDAPEESIETLFRQITALPAEQLASVLRRIHSPGQESQWLNALPEDTLERLLATLWKRDVRFMAAYRQLREQVLASRLLRFDHAIFRRKLLDDAVRTDTGRSIKQLLQTLLLAGAQASAIPVGDWAEWLRTAWNAQKTTGNVYFDALGELLKQVDTASVETDEVPALAPIFPETLPSENTPADVPYVEMVQTYLSDIRSFFQTGALPSRSDAATTAREFEQLLFRMLDKHPDVLLPFLRQLLEKQEAVQRLMAYFSERLTAAIAARFFAPHLEAYAAIRDELFRQLESEDKENLPPLFYTYLFQTLQSGRSLSGNLSEFTEGFIDWLEKATRTPKNQIWAHLRWMLEKPNNPMGLLGQVLPSLVARRLQQAQRLADRRLPDTPEVLEETISVHNAGLVLVAPFLPRLFGNLDLLDNRVFRDAAAAEKAVHLLQFLATGLLETPEHLLVFNKLICGMPIETPIPLGAGLNADEQEMCTSLLGGVLSNWDKMKNSSVDNLRGAFLLREGILREYEDRWLLDIEYRTYDIILDSIPWTISMVKLPWMEKRIDVEWKKKS